MVAGGYSQVTVYIFYSLIAVACAVAGIVGAGFFSGTRGRGGVATERSGLAVQKKTRGWSISVVTTCLDTTL